MDKKKRLKIEYTMKTLPVENKCKPTMGYTSGRETAVICGDSVSTCKLQGGKRAFVLSDGMGKGELAANKSKKVVDTLRKLLKQGLSPAKSIRIVNKQLIESSEVFATIDLLVVNEATGRANFYKMGAAKSYIVREMSQKTGSSVKADNKNKLRIIEPEALPVGIISKLVFKRTTVMLNPGDLVVMVSDGVTEADRNDLKCEWFKKLLQEIDTSQIDNLYVFAEDIISMAKLKQNYLKQDDMSVIVLRVE